MNIAYVGVGASIEPEWNILRAVDLMTRLTTVTGTSTFYRTPALDRPDDPDFVNGALQVNTPLSPAAFKATVLRLLERWAGRTRTQDPYAPRVLDLDLLVHADNVIDEPGFQLPDPDIRTRRFVAQPLFELAPSLVLPDTETPLIGILADLPASPMTPLDGFTRELCSHLCTPSQPETRDTAKDVPPCKTPRPCWTTTPRRRPRTPSNSPSPAGSPSRPAST